MSEDVKPEVIKRTQDSLGKFIKKPPLTEKLLKKPPFRFLHDIVTNVIQETGYLHGLLTEEEHNHENIKDRDSKIAFLQKVIDAVKATTGARLTVRPSKIVAGHEASKTNEFLQAIGKALEKQISSADYVAQLQKKDKGSKTRTSKKDEPPKSKSTTKTSGPSKSQSQERSRSKDPSKKKSSSSTSGQNTKPTKAVADQSAKQAKVHEVKSEPVNAQSVQEASPNLQELQASSEPVPEFEIPAPEPEPEPIPELEPKSNPELESEPLQQLQPQEPDPEVSKQRVKEEVKAEIDIKPIKEPEMVRPPSAVESRRKSAKISTAKAAKTEAMRAVTEKPELLKDENNEPIELGAKPFISDPLRETASPISQRIMSARPTTARRPISARPAAPRMRDKTEVVMIEEALPVSGKVNVITEVDPLKEQDEYDNFVVEEAPDIVHLEDEPVVHEPPPVLLPGEEGKHGHLVSQILETQKELEDDGHHSLSSLDGQHKKVEIEWEAGRQREKEIAFKEIDRLRASIQTLTRAANPLGKLMDFLQEDVDTMQRELSSWRATNRKLRQKLLEERSLTERSIEPMKVQLRELQDCVNDKLEQIGSMKASVMENEMKLNKLVTREPRKSGDIIKFEPIST